MFEGLARITALPAIILCSAWVWISKGMADGMIFGILAFIGYGAIVLVYAEMDKEKIKVEQRRM
jgi:hypothetical protein